MDEYRIENLEQFTRLWTSIYTNEGKVDWSHILPYYHREIFFKDSIQEIRGLDDFRGMTERLTKRSKNLSFRIHSSLMDESRIYMEWEMIIAYKKYPSSSVFGASRLTLIDGKICEQRDYYDLWGDIFDNIPFMRRPYRRFMRRKFG
ncbi:MAG: nuclear transport factor 2 family protein [Spirochaetales bacterium]|nr:nuclear transport factor 2 family protein [Spirochaetales bacterium]